MLVLLLLLGFESCNVFVLLDLLLLGFPFQLLLTDFSVPFLLDLELGFFNFSASNGCLSYVSFSVSFDQGSFFILSVFLGLHVPSFDVGFLGLNLFPSSFGVFSLLLGS
jgi:hypothetical protein